MVERLSLNKGRKIMKKLFIMFVIVVMLGFVPVMTSCQGLIDAVVGTEDNPSTTPTVSHITGITLSGEGIVNGELKINKGLMLQLIATIIPSDTQETDIYWSSSDASVVSVSTTGQITALKPGTAVVTVTSSIDTTKKASVTVFVLDGSLNVNDDPVDESTADTRG